MPTHLTQLALQRPLVVLDLETTGKDPRSDRVVEISALKLLPDGSEEHRTRRIHPGMPIPPGATAIHRISDADVADAPRFERVAASLLAYLDGCDLCGFNLKKFDLQILRAEFTRAGLEFRLEDRAIVDPLEIFHNYERRDLAAAVRFYCGREHDGAHGAEADVLATIEILDAMLARYADLPRSVAELNQLFKSPNAVDMDGKFTRVSDEIRFTFGKYRGQPLAPVAHDDPDYLNWILNKDDFAEDTKAVVREALRQAQRHEDRDEQSQPA